VRRAEEGQRRDSGHIRQAHGEQDDPKVGYVTLHGSRYGRLPSMAGDHARLRHQRQLPRLVAHRLHGRNGVGLGPGIVGVRRVYEGDPEFVMTMVTSEGGSFQPAHGPHSQQAIFEYGWQLQRGLLTGQLLPDVRQVPVPHALRWRPGEVGGRALRAGPGGHSSELHRALPAPALRAAGPGGRRAARRLGLMRCMDEKLELLSHSGDLLQPDRLWSPRDLDRVKGQFLHNLQAICHLRIRITEM
jgi:hypothetical protein